MLQEARKNWRKENMKERKCVKPKKKRKKIWIRKEVNVKEHKNVQKKKRENIKERGKER